MNKKKLLGLLAVLLLLPTIAATAFAAVPDERTIVPSTYTEIYPFTCTPGKTYSAGSSSENGAMFCVDGGYFIANNTIFCNNTTSKNGGAIYNTGTVVLSDAIFDGNVANFGGAIYNTGLVILKGSVKLNTVNDTIANDGGTITWDLTSATYGTLNDYNKIINVGGKMSILVNAEQATGKYTIATGVNSSSQISGKTIFTLTNGDNVSSTSIIVGGDAVIYNKLAYKLSLTDDGIILTVAKPTFEYTVTEGNAITATCKEYPEIKITVAVVASSGLVYDGTQKPAYLVGADAWADAGLEKLDIAYSSDYMNYSSDAPSSAGNHTARIATYPVAAYIEFTIAKKTVDVIGSEVVTKSYDGTATATVSGGILSGALAQDDVAIATAAGTYDNINVLGDHNVTATYTLKGFAAGNYEVSSSALIGDITTRKVTLTSADDTKTYDGTALTNDTITVGGEGWAAGEGADYTVSGAIILVGTAENDFDYTLKSTTSSANYYITVTKGTLTVNKITAKTTLTAGSVTKLYDGKELVYKEATLTGQAMMPGDNWGVVISSAITDAGVAANKIESYRVVNSDGVDVTYCYTIETADGKLEVTKRHIIVKSESATKVYDATPLTRRGVTVIGGDGLAEGESIFFETVGSRTKTGSSKNTIAYTAQGETNIDNYEIEVVEGTLTVKTYNFFALLLKYLAAFFKMLRGY